jgi:hypothetical protein
VTALKISDVSKVFTDAQAGEVVALTDIDLAVTRASSCR